MLKRIVEVWHGGPDIVFFTLILCYLSDALPVYQVTPSLAEQKNSPLKAKVLVVQSCPTLVTCGPLPTRLLCPWDSPGKNAGVDNCSLPQEIFLAQGSNPGLLPCRQILYHISQQGRAKFTFAINS